MITISVFRNAKDNVVRAQSLPLPDFIRLLTSPPEIGAVKEEGEMWSPCRYGGAIRNQKDALDVSCLALDFDKGKDGKHGLPIEDEDAVFEWLEKKEYLYAGHTTFTSGDYAPRRKFRIVLFFAKPVLPEQYNKIWDVLYEALPVKPDRARRDYSGNFFSPRCQEKHLELYESFSDGHKFVETNVFDLTDLNVAAKPRDWMHELATCENKHETLVKASFALGVSGLAGDEVWSRCRSALEKNTVSEPVKNWEAAEKTARTCGEAGLRRGQEERSADFIPNEKQLAKAAKMLRDAVRLVKADPGQLGNQAYLVGRYTPHVLGTAHVVDELSKAAAFTNKGAFVPMAEATMVAQAGITRGQAAPFFVVDPKGWRAKLEVNEKGGFAVCDSNLKILFQCHPETAGVIRWNVREDAAVYVSSPPWEHKDAAFPVRLRDSDGYSAAAWLAGPKVLGRSPAARTALEALLATAEVDRYDPFADWLEGVQWDGVARLDTWLIDYCRAKDTRYARAVGASFVIGAVARTLSDDAAVDTVLVLVGKENLGKSRSLAALAGKDLFSDELSNIKDKDAHLLMERYAIVEIAELDKFMQYDSADVKSFVTARAVYLRPAYARSARLIQRRAVLAASTNETAFLKSTTGNRRFYPVTVGTCSYKELVEVRTQLWAEAVARFKGGEQAWISDKDVLDEAREIQEEARVADELENELGFLDEVKPPTVCTEDARRLTGQGMVGREGQFSPTGRFLWVTVKQVCQHLDLDYVDQRNQKRIAKCLALRGWTSKQLKLQGEKLRVWENPKK